MAATRLIIDGFGQLELNNAAFRRDGRVEAQCKLDETEFASIPAENGMLLMVDRATRTVHLPDESKKDWLIGLHYSAEHMYDSVYNGLKDFKLTPGTFLPRLGYLATGDKFHTNCISYDSAKDSGWTDDEAFKTALADWATTAVYGGISEDGSILVSATKPTYGPVLRVINGASTMPDGQFAVQFEVVTA